LGRRLIVLSLTPAIFRHQAKIMLSVLEIIFCRHPVIGQRRVPRQGEIFLHDLLRISPNLNFRPVAVITV
jgi:hypothetical protein